MLDEATLKVYGNLLHLGCILKLIPFRWDGVRLQRAGTFSWAIFNLHFIMNSSFTVFAITRLSQATGKSNFPLLLRILNTAWIGIYLLTCFAHMQLQKNEAGVRQFLNWIIQYIKFRQEDRDLPMKPSMLHRGSIQMYDPHETKKTQTLMARYLLIGLVLWALNPGIHATLVDESPCAPHFSSSLFLPCEGFKDHPVPFRNKIPFIIFEYYLTTIIFTTFSFNWVIIMLGLAKVVELLRKMRKELNKKRFPNIVEYRTVEVLMCQLNTTFKSYLSTFTTLLFAVVSLLFFGVIRIWHYNPGSNLMFPLCGARCFYEGITPLALAGQVNDRNKEVLDGWRKVSAGKGKSSEKRQIRKYEGSFHGVMCKAGSLYSFENSIVLCCLHNMMQLTFNLLVTFKQG